MKAAEQSFLRFLEGNDKRFVIPVYQRNYDWRKEQCGRLFDDVLGIISSNFKPYFMGSIVCIYDGDDSEEVDFLIIDGQQRIATLSMLLLSIHNLLERGEIESEDRSRIIEQIRDSYLVNKHAPSEKQIRLKPVKQDNQAFEKLFDENRDSYIADSDITQNYLYLEERTKEAVSRGVKVDDIYRAVKNLMIVMIKLKRGEDNPHLIFESINSTGKQLEESDLVRNFILMDQEPETQEQLYEKFWHPIEKNTNHQVSDFVRDYLTYKLGRTPRWSDVYTEFKLFVRNRGSLDNEGLADLLTELLKFSKFYNSFLFCNTGEAAVDAALDKIRTLNVQVVYPYLLDLFKVWDDGIINAEQVAEVLSDIESFVFRRLICEVPTNSLNKIFATLGSKIRKVGDHWTQYCEVFRYYITAGKGSARFPEDEEFQRNLTEKDIYNTKMKNHLFDRLENYRNRETIDVASLINDRDGGLTFEHIMPKILPPAWKESLGDRFEIIHGKYLNTIGNLTLTGYNSQMGNKPFGEKRDMEDGFKQSRLWLNKSLHDLPVWGEQEIIERAKFLSDRSLQIWPYAACEYKPPSKVETQYYLYDDYDYTGTQPKRLSLYGEEHDTKSWRDLYKQTVTLLFDLDSVTLGKVIRGLNVKRKHYSADPAELIVPWELSADMHLEVNLSAEGVVQNLKYFLEGCKIDDSDFYIVLDENIEAD